MATYRLYCLDGASRFLKAEWLEANDDVMAMVLARDMARQSVRCELWAGNHLVARFDGESELSSHANAETGGDRADR